LLPLYRRKESPPCYSYHLRKISPSSSSILKTEVVCSSETLLTTCKSTQRHNPEDHGLWTSKSKMCWNKKYLFIPCSRVLLEELIEVLMTTKFSGFYGSRRIIALFTDYDTFLNKFVVERVGDLKTFCTLCRWFSVDNFKCQRWLSSG
jgi:hypothetical protein